MIFISVLINNDNGNDDIDCSMWDAMRVYKVYALVLGFFLDKPKVAMPVQYELRRLFHLMNIQMHQNSTQKALFLGAYFNS